MDEGNWFLWGKLEGIPISHRFNTEEDLATYMIDWRDKLEVYRIIYGVEKDFRWSVAIK